MDTTKYRTQIPVKKDGIFAYEIYLEKERCYKGRQPYRVSAQKWLLRRGEMINEETWRASGTKYKEIRQQT